MAWNSSPKGGQQPAEVEVLAVGSRRDRDDFVALPWKIYESDPQWVPPLVSEARAAIDPDRHPFYRHGKAQAFVARRRGEVVGRIVASDDPRFNAQHGTRIGCFGMFESIDDHRVAQGLLDAAANWLARRGLTTVRGPIDYSMNYPSGLLIDGFDTPPRVMMNHQPRYYAGLFESWGLAKSKDLYAWWFTDQNDMQQMWGEVAERIAGRTGVVIRPVRFGDFAAELDRCKQVYNDTWEANWGFVKMTDAEFEHLGRSLRQIANPELMLLAEIEGRPVGVSLTLPDINEAIKPTGGRLTRWGLPLGLIKLLYYRRRIKTVRMAVLGTLKEYRRRGIAELLMLRTLVAGRRCGYTGAELSWTLEDNDLINRAIQRVGGQCYKTYRIYERVLPV